MAFKGSECMTEQEFEKTVKRFCDGYCKFPYICKDEEQLHAVCDCCPVVELVEQIDGGAKDAGQDG